MKIITVPIGKRGAVLTCYLFQTIPDIETADRRPALLVLPGGGYEFISEREAEPVAVAYGGQGFLTFTLSYSVKEGGRYPIPQREAFEAVAYIRENAEPFGVDPKRLAVIGFSAGGHLAASTGVHWRTPDCIGTLDPDKCRPDALILVYPCITADAFAYPGIRTIHGAGMTDCSQLSMEKLVDKDTPPAFLCHTAADTCVSSINALVFAKALAEHGVAYELHIYKDGPHGLGLANRGVTYRNGLTPIERTAFLGQCAAFADWFDKSVAFLNALWDF